jgi:hypothetical protein
MFKFVSVILLLVICFLVGAIVGIDFNDQAFLPTNTMEGTEATEPSSDYTHTANEQSDETEVVTQESVAKELSKDNGEHISKQSASFLEGVVTGFYDMIVQIMYQFSQLFF